MLSKGKSARMREEEYNRYVQLTQDALRMRRESRNLDRVVERQRGKLGALEEELDGMLGRMKEVERLIGDMSNLASGPLEVDCGMVDGDSGDCVLG